MSAPTILIVEDETSIRYFLTETLSEAGYQVYAVESGEVAVEKIQHQTFDVALLDLHLPGMNGIDVLTILQQKCPTTTVIVLTAHASVETAVQALRKGAHDYLFKPCEPQQLRESIRSGLLKQQRQQRQQEVLTHLEHYVQNNLGELLTNAIEQAIAPAVAATQSPAQTDNGRYQQWGVLRVDTMQRTMALNDQPIPFSVTEFDLLMHLLGAAPRIVPPTELAHDVLDYQGEAWELNDLVRSHIYRMRQKIKAIDKDTSVIRTMRGAGYTIEEAYLK